MSVPLLGAPPEPPAAGPMIRLLFCTDCSSLDQLPPHDGPPETDVLLERLITDHHSHPVLGAHRGLLFTVPLSAWANETAKKAIIKQIREGLSAGADELDPNYYASRDQLRTDALECYSQHLRPKGGCPDYMSDSKRILPNTAAERKDVGLPKPVDAGVGVWLCQACPVNSYVVTQKRAAAGMYKA